MASEGVHRLPRVGSDGAVVGVVSTFDIVHWLADHAGYVLAVHSRRDARAAEFTPAARQMG